MLKQTQVKAPSVKSLADPEILSKAEKTCKLKAQIDLLMSLLDASKAELLEIEAVGPDRKVITTPFGSITYCSGNTSEVLSEMGKARINLLKAELATSGDLVKTQGSPYLKVSSSAQATLE